MMCSKHFRSASAGRRGSALLIVLGMFAFMLVSAVSFSIYMRASRAPSSYVRRNASARHLVKAALARAIDEIDTAIGNDPFPGVGYNNKPRGSEPDPNPSAELNVICDTYGGKNDNWRGRVFTPMGAVPAKDTVSTLTLEALGYIPPCLVNEARYWSRHTRTATPRPFGYGLGEYAFTAINVSDFFDLGALAGKDNGQRRQYLNRSSAPHGRISPTYLFRGGDRIESQKDLTKGEGDASEFLDSLANGRKEPADIPLVSLMDFNLTYRDKPWAVKPPFLAKSGMYLGGEISKEDALGQVFIAGGWNGASNLTWEASRDASILDLSFPEAQPFFKYGNELQDADEQALTRYMCMREPCNTQGDAYFWHKNIFGVEKIPSIGRMLMCDYLDKNSIPMSLCIPCCEAVPMLCGAMIGNGTTIKCVNDLQERTEEVVVGENPDGSQKKEKFTVHTYSLKVEIPGVSMKLATVYPFRSDARGTYTADVAARVFLSAHEGLRMPSGTVGLGAELKTWPEGKEDASVETVIKQVVKLGESVKSAAPANQDSAATEIPNVLLTGWNTIEASAELWYNEAGDIDLSRCTCEKDFTFFDKDGKAVKFFDTLKTITKKDGSGGLAGVHFMPSVAVWVRIKDDADKTVDMVPAIGGYDNLNSEVADEDQFYNATGANSPAGHPMLRFWGDKAFSFELTYAGFKKSADVTFDKGAFIAVDPRINWAPEHWFWADGCTAPRDEWLNKGIAFRNDNYWCDPDIYMAVSDQGYLQSMYELLMIPQTRCLSDNNGGLVGVWGNFADSTVYDGVLNTTINDVAHKELMWRTYRSNAFIPREKNGVTDPGAWNPSGGNLNNWGSIDDFVTYVEPADGIRVNPYTDITNIMMGAFANMPSDWWSAGTNYINESDKNYMKPDSTDFKKDYLFGWSSQEGKPVYALASYWMNAFRDKDPNELYQPDAWKHVFDDSVDVLDWYTGEIIYRPGSVDINELENTVGLKRDSGLMTSVDRKFLYGYLKGCFANTHQLFLVFVRAEAAAGGGGAGSGARAVALVWRDPKAPEKASGRGEDNAQLYMKVEDEDEDVNSWHLRERKHPPHRCRVLFYHQLD